MKRIIKFFGIGIGIVFICMLLTAIYVFYIEPKLLIVKKYEMKEKGAGEEAEEFTVVQFSDVHIGKFYKEQQFDEVVEKINRQNPDIIVFTGDLFDIYSQYHPDQEVINRLKNMKATYGKYSIWGNRDYGGGASRKYAEIMKEGGFKLLRNESEQIHLENGKKLFIGGVDDGLLGQPDLEKTLKENEASDYKLILMHEPDQADALKESGVNLILAGHSHGGQVRIPFYKGITTSMAKKYNRNFYEIDSKTDMKLYVNTGIGTTKIPARFMVPPEISVFYIKIK